jgi:hypothetical protein
MEENDAIEQMLNDNPLIGFSIYTEGQWETVRDLGQEVIQGLEKTITKGDGTASTTVDGTGFQRSYGQFWLWVLGAYEIVRTMCQAEKCFSPRLNSELTKLKKRLSTIRVPFAKQELPGRRKKRVPVGGEPSVFAIGDSPCDLTYKVDDQEISARKLIAEFERVFEGISRADVLADHRTSYLRGSH